MPSLCTCVLRIKFSSLGLQGKHFHHLSHAADNDSYFLKCIQISNFHKNESGYKIVMEQKASFQSLFLAVPNRISSEKHRALYNIVKVAMSQGHCNTMYWLVSRAGKKHMGFQKFAVLDSFFLLDSQNWGVGPEDKNFFLLLSTPIGRLQSWGNKQAGVSLRSFHCHTWAMYLPRDHLVMVKYIHTSLLYECVALDVCKEFTICLGTWENRTLFSTDSGVSSPSFQLSQKNWSSGRITFSLGVLQECRGFSALPEFSNCWNS